MATLTHSITYFAGTLAKASEVNTNFSDTRSWSSAGGGGANFDGIQNDNFGKMTGPVNWVITTGGQAINISNSDDEGSIEVTQSSALLAGKAGIKLSHTAAEVNADAGLFVDFTSASSTVPMFRQKNAGSGPFALYEDGSAVEQYRVGSDGKITLQAGPAISFVDSTTMDISPSLQVDGGPIFSKSTVGSKALLLDNALVMGLDDGPILDRNGPKQLRIQDRLTLFGTGSATLGVNASNQLTVSAGILVTGNSDITGDLDVTGALTTGSLSVTGTFSTNELELGSGTPRPKLSASNSQDKNITIKDSLGNQSPIVASSQNDPGVALRIVRGLVSSTGTKLSGEGFTVARKPGFPTGEYRIIWSSAFGDQGVVVVTPDNAGVTAKELFATITASSSGQTDVVIYETTGIPPTIVDAAFHFIAMGKRN